MNLFLSVKRNFQMLGPFLSAESVRFSIKQLNQFEEFFIIDKEDMLGEVG